jgi:5-methylcytosine-specific restriction endonuclease McrA
VGRVPTRAEYAQMLTDASTDLEVLDVLPPDTPRALDRLAGSQLGRKDKRLTRRSHMPQAHSPKVRVAARKPDGHAAWVQLRELAYIRAGFCCERCGVHRDSTFERTLDGHHRKLRARGGLDELSNIAVLCRSCHEWAHGHPKTATGLGFIVPSRAVPGRRAMLLHGDRWRLLTDAGGYELAA